MHSIRRVGLTITMLLTSVFSAQAQEAPKPTVADQEGQHDAAKKAADQAKAAAAKAKSASKALKPTADDLNKVEGKKLKPNWNSNMLRVPKMGFPWIEHHGYMRLRTDLFHGFSLGTYDPTSRSGSSPFLPPLTEIDENGNLLQENHRFAQGAESLAAANIRFRYQPTMHVSESLRIHSTFDILDNLVLGSTPIGGPHAQRTLGAEADRYALADPALALFNDGQRPPESGMSTARDGIRVKHLWGEWTSPLGVLAFGRMPNHWGLGLAANAGQCIDCDFGDSVDRIMGTTLLLDTYLSVGWDFASEGATGFPGDQTYANQGLGQPHDLEQRDDVSQYTVAIFRRPISQKEKSIRQRNLYEARKLVMDWGVYNVIRTQTVESGYGADTGAADNAFQYQLMEVDGFTYMPDLWLDFNYAPNPKETYRLQLEALGVFGAVEEVPQQYALEATACTDGSDPEETDCEQIDQRRRDIQRLGYAMEFDATHGKLQWGLHHGLASGDKSEGFGYLSNSELRIPDGSLVSPDQELTAMRFDRDYHVDLILFRELIGGVTNATYVKPYIGYRFIDTTSEAWGFTFSTLYGHALEANATPGNDASLGLEFDLELYIHEYDRFQLRFMYGLLFPMAAFNRLDESGLIIDEPSAAQTLQALIGIEF